jgi:pimeloyl-ACP methyl ester carboxylesterase
MLDLLDLLLLQRGIPADDRTLVFRRIDGNPNSRVIYFLPWHTPFGVARHAGFAPLDFLACYEMPPGIVSSEPGLCLQAMLRLVADAERLLREARAAGPDAVLVGLSIGSYPATYLANRIGARLCSVASADRADLAIWQSPATRLVRRRAEQRGLRLADYSSALFGSHPAENLAGIARDSVFVIGQRDPYVPPRRKAALLEAIASHVPSALVAQLDAGHVGTLAGSGRYQRAMLGIETSPRRWQFRLPFSLPAYRTAAPGPPSPDATA